MLNALPMIMGVLNVTPDSFSDGGRYLHPELALTHALKMYTAGADVIDIGGESTRPGAVPVSPQEELDRIMIVLEKIKQEIPVLISVDTSKPRVMNEAIKQGVWMMNDIHSLQSPGALELLADASCQICLMHKQGQPATMQDNPEYADDVIEDVLSFLKQRISATTKAGIDMSRLWLDPGIGFGKTTSHNLSLLKNISEFLILGLPLMVGISRKSIFGHLLKLPVDDRQSASLATAVYLLLQGVKMIRTHDVKGTKEAVIILKSILNG